MKRIPAFEEAMAAIRILDCGEQALVVELGSEIDPKINARVRRLAKHIAAAMPERILELVPTYRSLMIYFDPLITSRSSLREEVARLLPLVEAEGSADEARRVIVIPVCYGGEFGPDLDFVARHNCLTEDEVVAIHTSAAYLVYMLGFTPGFPYLGGMSERIAAPRLDVPRLKIPSGSVGIAGNQTGVYPVESPGGWRLIGRTPIRIFDPQAERPFLFSPGDYVQFAAIDSSQYRILQRQVESEDYSPEIRAVRGVERVHGH